MPHRHATSLGAAVLLLALALAGPAMAEPAPAVTVTFAGVDHYADAGHGADEVQRNLQRLEHCLQRLGEQSLQDGQHLRIEVTQLALAGTTGGPRITLRYLLRAPDGQVVQVRQATLDDAARRALRADHASAADGSADEPLPRERRLLARWFEQEFGAPLRVAQQRP
jgi:hypothetical protein